MVQKRHNTCTNTKNLHFFCPFQGAVNWVFIHVSQTTLAPEYAIWSFENFLISPPEVPHQLPKHWALSDPPKRPILHQLILITHVSVACSLCPMICMLDIQEMTGTRHRSRAWESEEHRAMMGGFKMLTSHDRFVPLFRYRLCLMLRLTRRCVLIRNYISSRSLEDCGSHCWASQPWSHQCESRIFEKVQSSTE